jgi:putative ABC transport system permease protein
MNRRLLLAGSVRVLSRYKLRTFFMSLGIVIGVAALVITRSLGSGAERDLLEKIERMFSASTIYVMNTGGGMRGRREPGQLTIADIEAIAAELDQVIDWDPMLTGGDHEVQYGGRSRSLMVWGHSERAEWVQGRGVSRGEFFSEADLRSTARVVLLGSKAAETLFGDEDPLGQQVLIDSAPYRVKGILEDHGMDPHGLDRDDEVHIPISTLMRRMLNVDTIGTARLAVASAEEVDETADRVAEILQERHGLAPDQPDDFSIFTPMQVQRMVKKANRVLTVYLPATAGIALLVAVIVITNLMLIGVRERIPEIGLRKALGATSRQINGQFLLESLAVAVVSGGLGVGLAVTILTGLIHVSPETRITGDSLLLGLAAALLVGMLAGFLPARRAALLEPVDALR